MTDADLLRLVEQYQRHEDAVAVLHPPARFRMFKDTKNKWTIGWGRNIQDRGLSPDEADYLLGNDLNDAKQDLERALPWFKALDSVRQALLTELCLNMGLDRLLTFQKALTAMSARDYGRAADEFFDSAWATQVGHRAVEICDQIRAGRW